MIVRMTYYVIVSGQAYIPPQPVYVNSGLGVPTGHITHSNYSSNTVSSSLAQLPQSFDLPASAPALLPQGTKLL